MPATPYVLKICLLHCFWQAAKCALQADLLTKYTIYCKVVTKHICEHFVKPSKCASCKNAQCALSANLQARKMHAAWIGASSRALPTNCSFCTIMWLPATLQAHILCLSASLQISKVQPLQIHKCTSPAILQVC